MTEEHTELAELARLWRLHHGITKLDAAEECGVSIPDWSNLEVNRTAGTITAAKIEKRINRVRDSIKLRKALEFAEYMAKSGEFLMQSLNDLSEFPKDDDRINQVSEAFRGLRSDIYEFRKRAELCK